MSISQVIGTLVQDLAQDETQDSMAVEIMPWGYAVRCRAVTEQSDRVRVVLGRFFGAVALLVAVSIWLWPGATFALSLIAMKLLATSFFVGIGAMLLWSARPVPVQEVQFDTARGEFRAGCRGKDGQFDLMRVAPLDDLTAMAKRPLHGRLDPLTLLVKLAQRADGMEKEAEADSNADLRARVARDLLESGPAPLISSRIAAE
ncbi:MAG: hypothetical protein CR993_08105 [Rhodobacterales bacterium]|nr:MAG: hypothetical protein CR993_08105 [Rhodobacterales bacterium]